MSRRHRRFLLSALLLARIGWPAVPEPERPNPSRAVVVYKVVGSILTESDKTALFNVVLGQISESNARTGAQLQLLDELHLERGMKSGSITRNDDVAELTQGLGARFGVNTVVDSSSAGLSLRIRVRDLSPKWGDAGQTIMDNPYPLNTRAEILSAPVANQVGEAILQKINPILEGDLRDDQESRSVLIPPFRVEWGQGQPFPQEDVDRLFFKLAAKLSAGGIRFANYDNSRQTTDNQAKADLVSKNARERKILFGRLTHLDTGWKAEYGIYDRQARGTPDIFTDTATVGFGDLETELLPRMVSNLGCIADECPIDASAARSREKKREEEIHADQRRSTLIKLWSTGGIAGLLLIGGGLDCAMGWHLCKETPEETTTMKLRW